MQRKKRDALIKILVRVDALGNLWARGYKVYPPDLNPKFANVFNYFQKEITFNNKHSLPKKWFNKIHAIYSICVRKTINDSCNEQLIIDLVNNVLKIRGIMYRKAIISNLYDSEVKYVKERLNENGKAKLAYIWVDDKFLYVAIIFKRKVKLYETNAILSIDINALNNGITYAIIANRTIRPRPVYLRPNLRKIDNIYKQIEILKREYETLKILNIPKKKEVQKKIRNLKNLCNN